MSLEDDLRAAQTRISAATAARARDQVELENAQAALTTAKTSLAELGITTGAELKAELERLDTDIADELAQVSVLLDAAGA